LGRLPGNRVTLLGAFPLAGSPPVGLMRGVAGGQLLVVRCWWPDEGGSPVANCWWSDKGVAGGAGGFG